MTRTLDDVAAAAKVFRELEAAARKARGELHAKIVAAAKTGDQQVHIVEASRYKREQVRRILRAAGVKPSPDDDAAGS